MIIAQDFRKAKNYWKLQILLMHWDMVWAARQLLLAVFETRNMYIFVYRINHLVKSGKSKKENTSADIWPIRYICALLYLLKEDCKWRGIPHDFPNREAVHYHYNIWSKPNEDGVSLLDQILQKLIEAEREKHPRCRYRKGKGLWCGKKPPE